MEDIKQESNSSPASISKQQIKLEKSDQQLDEDYSPPTYSLRKLNKKPKREYPCKVCGEKFSNEKKLSKHRKQHKKTPEDVKKYEYTYNEEDKTYICNTCECEYKSKEEMEKHLEEHVEKYSCPECSEVFTDLYKCSTHIYQHNQDQFVCVACGYKTMQRTSMLSHVRRMHLQKYIYHCQYCGKGFDNCKLYQEHEMNHLNEKPQFQCVVCDKRFVYSSYLHAHQVRYHKVTIEGVIMVNQCEVCLKVFSKLQSLLSHMKIHTKVNVVHEKKHLCEICGKGYARPDKLKIHYRTHTGYKPYSCNYCTKSFIKKEYLVMHERIHSGEKPYSCDYCGKCFNQGAPLRIHIRSHTGERPYVCHLCDSKFASKGALNLHLKCCPGRLV